jgi:hypothetical protein
MKKEIYKNYIIHDDGTIESKKRRGVYKGFVKPHLSHGEYWRVGLHIDGKQKLIYLHKLLAEAFIPNPDPKKYTQVNHKDCNKQNNSLSNLEWVTHQENVQHARDNNLPKVESNTKQKHIYFDKNENRYSVIFRRLGHNNRIGRFKELKDAIMARDNFMKTI